MNRNSIQAAVFIWLSLMAVALLGAEKPNILLIAIDDLRPDPGCYGAGHISSPNIDQFAATAIDFTRAYCQQSVCNPSRTSLMADLRPDTIGVTKFDDENGTSFENARAGEFKELKTRVGTWNNSSGRVLVDSRHSKSGKQCLQIAGGEKSSVELSIGKNIKTGGQLSFWAERWTARSPFSFRIEKQSGGEWTEIFDGDQQVVVGREFLSKVKIPLSDPDIKKLRFSVTSPPDTGILIDDLSFAPAAPQEIVSVQVVPLALPALVGKQSSALLKIKIETTGSLNPISLTEVSASLEGTMDLNDIANVQLQFVEPVSKFLNTSSTGPPVPPAKKVTLTGQHELAEGTNYVWIVCKLSPNANIDNRVGAACLSIGFSNNEAKFIDSAPSIQRLGVAVRDFGDDGVDTYRIPGLATTNKGTLIGVYDIRRRSGGDLPGDIDVGMSRSTDGGRTWEKMQVIMDMGNDPKFRFDGIGDPTVMVDRNTGTIWVAATWSHGNRSWVGSQPGLEPVDTGQLMLVKSQDDGVTWSKPINITKQVKKPEWSFLLQGPGKGITMSDGTIVLPAQYLDPPNDSDKKANRLPHSTFIYSRDHGETWKCATGAWDDTTESQLVELSDGVVMLNCRYNRGPHRAIMTTRDLGVTWQEHPTHIKDLIEPGSCMASLINVGRELGWRNLDGFDNDFLLFSNPDSIRGRNHMTIKASTDAGQSWPIKHQLLLDERGGRGYSCMSMIDSETVGILYEGSQAHMTFQRVKIADILNPPTDQKTKNPAFSSRATSSWQPPSTLSLARVFGDRMVLQAEQPIRVWGESKPNSKVSVQFADQSVIVNAGAKGKWMAEFAPQKINARGRDLVATSGTEAVVVADVLVGEVWFCAGQSNMEWPLAKTTIGAKAIESSHDPLLRLLNFPGKARGSSGNYNAEHFAALVPERFSSGAWAVASRESAKDFSGIGYYFARELRKNLNVPVGMINVAAGGTPIEAWVNAARIQKHPALSNMLSGNWLNNPALDEWCKQRARANLQSGIDGEFEMLGDKYGPNHSFKPGFMHAASVVPFQPMSIRGVLWYQGESNAENPARIYQYQQAFPLMVESWRQEFKNENMPFVFVQLPALGRDNWPVFREQQRRSLSELNHVGMAITLDVGHRTNVHPKTKLPVGQRLAAWALAETYNKPVVASGPLFTKASKTDGNKMKLHFDHVANGLKTSDDKPPRHFEVAGENKLFFPASARINGRDEILIFCKDVSNPVHARYAWKAYPEPPVNLIGSSGFPASPFTSVDDYLELDATNLNAKLSRSKQNDVTRPNLLLIKKTGINNRRLAADVLYVAQVESGPINSSGYRLASIFETKSVTDWRKHLVCKRNREAAIGNFTQRTIRDKRYKLIWSSVRDRTDPPAIFYSDTEPLVGRVP